MNNPNAAANLVSFPKGKSGNPGGIPKEVVAVRKLAATNARAALERLIVLSTKARSETVQVLACNAILDRALGKPKQQMTIDGDGLPLASIKIMLVNVENGTDSNREVPGEARMLIPAE